MAKIKTRLRKKGESGHCVDCGCFTTRFADDCVIMCIGCALYRGFGLRDGPFKCRPESLFGDEDLQ